MLKKYGLLCLLLAPCWPLAALPPAKSAERQLAEAQLELETYKEAYSEQRITLQSYRAKLTALSNLLMELESILTQASAGQKNYSTEQKRLLSAMKMQIALQTAALNETEQAFKAYRRTRLQQGLMIGGISLAVGALAGGLAAWGALR
jgi:chromosome segregation ATPase